MFGRRRRRTARAAEQADRDAQSSARAASDTSPAAASGPLTHAQVSELLHGHLDGLIGARGVWTLVRRQSDDTEVFFHDLAAREIAATLATALSTPVSRPANAKIRLEPVMRGASTTVAQTDEATAPVAHLGEPLALPWSPRPISRWADPSPESAAIPVHTADATRQMTAGRNPAGA